jgi:hypothetical protein
VRFFEDDDEDERGSLTPPCRQIYRVRRANSRKYSKT